MKLSDSDARYDKSRADSANSAIKAAENYGFDMSLVDANLRKTPEQRILDINKLLAGILELRKNIMAK